jgi:hypothetical protein
MITPFTTRGMAEPNMQQLVGHYKPALEFTQTRGWIDVYLATFLVHCGNRNRHSLAKVRILINLE